MQLYLSITVNSDIDASCFACHVYMQSNNN